MQYHLDHSELEKFKNALRTAISIPFIDDIEDYVVEAIWEYVKDIVGNDPFLNIRSKKLYDVTDNRTNTGWSVKSIMWNFFDDCEFELVIQRADVFKKAIDLGFPPLDENSDPNLIGAALLKHWQNKVINDASSQNVDSKRIMILLKSKDNMRYAILEEDINLYQPDELHWEWTNERKNGLKAHRLSDDMCVYRWYSSQKQFFERFKLPPSSQKFTIDPMRLTKAQVVDILLPLL